MGSDYAEQRIIFMNEDADVSDLIKGLFSGKDVAVVVSWGVGDVGMIYDEERELVRHAGEKRQMEFAAGRECARDALGRLGVEGSPVLMDSQGAPVWPEGVIGSIAHAKGCCAAVVALSDGGESVGLDIEEVGRVKESVWDYVFLPKEVEWLRMQSDMAGQWAGVLFTAKEAFYKAQYPLSGLWLGFRDVVVGIDEGGERGTMNGEITVRLLKDFWEWSEGEVFSGRYGFFEGYVGVGVGLEGC